MKKFGKFIFGTAVLAAIGAGAYFVYKNLIQKDSDDDFDDFDDDFEDSDEKESESDSREYVPINISPEVSTEEASEEPADSKQKDAAEPEDEQ